MNELAVDKIQKMQERAATRLVPLLTGDLPLSIRAHAALAIAKTHASGSGKAVLGFFNAYPDLEESIQAVAEVGGEEALAQLIGRVHEKRACNRDIIADVLAGFRSPAGADCLKELLGDEDRHVRFQAANSLFAHGGRESALALCRYISDRDEWISMTILRILCRMKEHESIPFLAEQFAKDGDLRRKAQMVSFLSMFHSITLVNIFDEGLKGKDARLKANSIEAIGELELPHREIQARIMPYLHDPNNRIRANTILALARAQTELVRPEIVQMVDSSDVQLRRSAAYILGQISPAGNEELAAKLIVDQSDDVRRRMVLSLRKFPPDFVRSQVERAITDHNKWIRKFAVEMAAGFPEFPKQPVVRQFKLETSYPNIVACIEFFARHPDDEGVRLIRQRVKDPRHQVVSAVIRAVGAIYGLKGLQALAPQINSRDPKIFSTYVTTHFGMGGVELFDSVLEKAVQVKKPPTNDMFLNALEGCLDVLGMGEKMPPALVDELSRVPIMPVMEDLQAAQPVVPAVSGEIQPGVPLAEPPKGDGLAEGVPVPPAEEAEAGAEEPARRPKTRVPASFSAGVKLYNLGKYKKARVAFRETLVDHPDLAKAHYYLGMMAFGEKEFDAARESLSLYLESEPDNRKAMHTLARIYKQQRDWPNVARLYEKLTAGIEGPLDKIGVKMMRELGTSYIFMKRYQDARTVLETVFKSDPTDLETNFHLSMSCFHLQNYMRAETLLMDIMRQAQPGEKLRAMAESLLDKIREQLSAPSEQNVPQPASEPESEPEPESESESEPEPEPGFADDQGAGEPKLGFLDELPIAGMMPSDEEKNQTPAFDPSAFANQGGIGLPSMPDLDEPESPPAPNEPVASPSPFPHAP
ncbi:MAG TPA: HEAT repeat domain-containing protein, partial [Candidatus Ozemobacteraceae bacterium]|nr:HEAT repeat domain-containing protein [Candidatus Ozemobacteraceae bacterium]